MKLVILESPYAGDIEANVAYARACVRDSLSRGEAPIASHLLYTQPGILRDDDPEERQWGIDAGLAWGAVATATVVYTDKGISRGMAYGIEAANRAGRAIKQTEPTMTTITQADIVAILRLDTETGELHWLTAPRGRSRASGTARIGSSTCSSTARCRTPNAGRRGWLAGLGLRKAA